MKPEHFSYIIVLLIHTPCAFNTSSKLFGSAVRSRICNENRPLWREIENSLGILTFTLGPKPDRWNSKATPRARCTRHQSCAREPRLLTKPRWAGSQLNISGQVRTKRWLNIAGQVYQTTSIGTGRGNCSRWSWASQNLRPKTPSCVCQTTTPTPKERKKETKPPRTSWRRRSIRRRRRAWPSPALRVY